LSITDSFSTRVVYSCQPV